MEDDDDEVFGPLERGFKPKIVSSTEDELDLRAYKLCDPTKIPPRPWLYGFHALRGFVSVLVAPGGTGKTTYAMTVAACLASGRSLLGERVFVRCNVAVLNLEDPQEEQDRRFAAIRIFYGLGEDDLEGRYFGLSNEDRPLVMAALGPDKTTVLHPDEDALVRLIRANNIGCLIVDPYAESHRLNENDNIHTVAAMKAWRRVARRTNCAIFLVHHVRKGIVSDIDSARGAKALTDSARVGMVMATMSEAEALELGIDVEERHRFVRLDDAKSNMGPRAGKAQWFELRKVELHNCDETYPNGDGVAVVAPWDPPKPFDGMTSLDCNRALDDIEAGPEIGVRFNETKRGGKQRWCGHVLMGAPFSRTQKQAETIIEAWFKSGLLTVETYHRRDRGEDARGVFVDPSKRPS